MGNKAENLITLAKERGYALRYYSEDYSTVTSSNSEDFLLVVYTLTGEFQLSYLPTPLITISTNKCGSFENDKHFNRMENKLREIVNRL